MINNKALEAKSKKKYSRNKKIGLFAFFALTGSMVLEIYEFPTFATSGWSLILFLLLAGLCWFIPTAICAAEMATIKKWGNGGVYVWVSNLLGRQWGFAAVFFQWFETLIGFVTMLYFVTTSFSYAVAGDAGFELVNQVTINGSQSNTYSALILFAIVVAFVVLITCSQLFGIKYTTYISRVGFCIGVLLPALLLIGYGISYLVGHGLENIGTGFFPSNESMNVTSRLIVFCSFILSYMGIEASAANARNLTNPKKQYPIAIFILVGVVITISACGAIMIAIAVPPEGFSLSGGIIQAMLILSENNHVLVRIMAMLLCVGTIAEVSGWVVGPANGLLYAARQKDLPTWVAQTNRFDVPYVIIGIQTCLVIVWAAIITFALGSNGSIFLSAMTLTVMIYLFTYVLMFIAYFKLIFKENNIERSFRIKSKWLQITIATSGLLFSVFAFIICFFPQSSDNFNYVSYIAILLPCFFVSISLPFIIFWSYEKYKNKKNIVV